MAGKHARAMAQLPPLQEPHHLHRAALARIPTALLSAQRPSARLHRGRTTPHDMAQHRTQGKPITESGGAMV